MDGEIELNNLDSFLDGVLNGPPAKDKLKTPVVFDPKQEL